MAELALPMPQPPLVKDRLDPGGVLWGMWLGLTPIVTFVIAPPRGYVSSYGQVDTRFESPLLTAMMAVCVAFGAIPTLWTIARRNIQIPLVLPAAGLFLPAVSMILLSLVRQPETKDLLTIALALVVIGGLLVMGSQAVSTTALGHPVLATIAIMHAITLVVALVDNNWTAGRFQGRIGSNYWGAVAAYAALAALVIRNKLLRVAVIGICIYVMLATQSRSSMFAAIAGFSMVFALYFTVSPPRLRLKIGLFAILGLGVLIIAFPYLYSKVFLLDDARRGIDSGGTGRAGAWEEAWAVIRENPFFGVGYRHHERFITVASSAHNAYLATTADMGVLGLFTYVAFMLTGLTTAVLKALRTRKWVFICIAGPIAGYMVQGFAEQRAFNFANSISLLTMCCVLLSVRREPVLVTVPADAATEEDRV